MKLKSLSICHAELRRLKYLYNSSIYAYKITADNLCEYKHYLGVEHLRDEGVPDEVLSLCPHPAELPKRYKSQYPKYLIEIILVRMVSCLEVMFHDTLLEAYLVRKDLFKFQGKIELHKNEILFADNITLLWDKIIKNELRKAQSKGLNEVAKYYKNILSIDFSQAPIPFKKLIYIFDTRHVLVHRLGKTDDIYRNKHNYANKRVSVTDSNLLEYFDVAHAITDWLKTEVSTKLSATANRINKPNYSVEYNILVSEEESEYVLDELYSFLSDHDGKICLLKDILKSRIVEIDKFTIVLTGNRKTILTYYKIIKSHERNGAMKILNKKVIFSESNPKDLKSNLSEEMFKNIIDELTNVSIKKGTYKRIAKKLGISNNKANKAIKVILRDNLLDKS